jgi:two-component system, OmpR family, sensor histidine kinase CiaH
MSSSKKYRPLFWFYIVCAYVVLQLLWWGVLLYRINNESVVNFEQGANYSQELRAIGTAAIQTKRDRRVAMIIGEGIVFLSLLAYGIYMVRKSFKREAYNNHVQSNFLMSVTHELKTPIASARLQLETLEKHTLKEEQRQTIISNALKDTDRLEVLVDNILMVSKFENDTVKISNAPFDLCELITDCVAHFKHGLGNKHIWKLELPVQYGIVSDKMLWQIVLNNLLDNARKYSPIDSEIMVQLKISGKDFELSVIDQGMGINDQDKKNVFEKFYRVENESVRSSKGTGLGLYIVRKLSEVIQLHVSVSDNISQGSCFKLISEAK